VSRLDNIIARNQRSKRPNEKVLVTLVLAVIILVLLVLAVFTDLGKPPIPAHAGEAAAGSGDSAVGSAEPVAPENQRHNYAPGILLRSSSPRPAGAPSPSAPAAPSPSAPSPTAPSPTPPRSAP